MQSMSDVLEQQAQAKLEQQVQDISQRIMEKRSGDFGTGPIEDLSQDDLVKLVDTEFDRCGLNYVLLGNFDSYGSTEIKLPLKTSGRLQNIDEVREILNSQVERYIRDLEKTCQKCKAIIFNHLRTYQDEQNRKKQKNPYSN